MNQTLMNQIQRIREEALQDLLLKIEENQWRDLDWFLECYEILKAITGVLEKHKVSQENQLLIFDHWLAYVKKTMTRLFWDEKIKNL